MFELARGLGVFLAAEGVGVWSDTGTLPANRVGITYRGVPDRPAGLVTISPYPVQDSPNLSTTAVMVQFRYRTPGTHPRTTDDLADRVFSLLQGRRPWTLDSGVTVVQCLRESAVTLGQDPAGRWSRADNYRMVIHAPSEHRE